jgi:hypothetical protein
VKLAILRTPSPAPQSHHKSFIRLRFTLYAMVNSLRQVRVVLPLAIVVVSLSAAVFFASQYLRSIPSADSGRIQRLPSHDSTKLSVSGSVVDQERRPIVGAMVTVSETGEKTTTIDGGRFSLSTSANLGEEIRLEVQKGEHRSSFYYPVGVPSGEITLKMNE